MHMSNSKKNWNAAKAQKRSVDAYKKNVKIKNIEVSAIKKMIVGGR